METVPRQRDPENLWTGGLGTNRANPLTEDVMSQRNVELIIGKLVTDEDCRRDFRSDATGFVNGLLERGTQLTRSEVAALVTLDPKVLDRFADDIDPRLQKASLLRGGQLLESNRPAGGVP